MSKQYVFDIAREVCGKWPDFMSNPELQEFAARIEQRKCKELADKIARMPFGDTAASFAIWIKEQS